MTLEKPTNDYLITQSKKSRKLAIIFIIIGSISLFLGFFWNFMFIIGILFYLISFQHKNQEMFNKIRLEIREK